MITTFENLIVQATTHLDQERRHQAQIVLQSLEQTHVIECSVQVLGQEHPEHIKQAAITILRQTTSLTLPAATRESIVHALLAVLSSSRCSAALRGVLVPSLQAILACDELVRHSTSRWITWALDQTCSLAGLLALRALIPVWSADFDMDALVFQLGEARHRGCFEPHVLEEWTHCFLGLVLSPTANTTVQAILRSATIAEELSSTLLLSPGVLNSVNTLTFKTVNVLLDFFIRHPELETPFYEHWYKLIAPLEEVLVQFTQTDNSWQELGMPCIAEYITEALQFFQKVVKDERFYSAVAIAAPRLVCQVCLTILSTTHCDYFTFADNPEEFVQRSLDLVGSQRSHTLQSEAAKLLKLLSVRIEWCLTSLVSTFLPLLPFTKECCGLKELNIETSFLVLTILYQSMRERPDLLEKLSQLVLVHDLRGLERARCCLFLGKYFPSIALHSTDLAATWMKFLIASIEDEELSVVIQTCETLRILLTKMRKLGKSVKSKPSQLIQELVSQLLLKALHLVARIDQVKFYEMLQVAVKMHPSAVGPVCLPLIEALVFKVLSEVGTPQIAEKCWDILHSMTETPGFGNIQERLESIILPLNVAVARGSAWINRYIGFLASCMLNTSSFLPKNEEILHTFRILQRNQQGRLHSLFDCLCIQISLGFQEQSALQMLVEMVSAALHSVGQDANAQAALLYQCLLQTQRGQLNEFLPLILSNVLLRYRQGCTDSRLKVHLLGVFFSAVFYDKNETVTTLQHYLAEENALEFFIVEFLKNDHCFEQAYETRVAVCGAIQLAHDVKHLLPRILASITKLLHRTVLCEQQWRTPAGFHSPFEGMDEFEQFKQFMNQVLASCPETVKEVLLEIPERVKQQLIEVLHIQRSTRSSVIRKIVRVRGIETVV